MGVSFKVSKVGTRYRPKVSPAFDILTDSRDDIRSDKSPISESVTPVQTQAASVGLVDDAADISIPSALAGVHPVSLENEVSFSLNLFSNGFSIGKPAEGMLLPLLQDVPKLLHPYDRASETLFSAVESGWLPGDILDDIPCKYINGTIVCEVWDYRNCMPKSGSAVSSRNKFPIVQRVRLRMCTENVIKDMSSISHDSWTYRDLLEVESRIVKAMQPELCLDPNPLLDRLCKIPGSKMLNLGICGRRQRQKQSDVPATNLMPINPSHAQNISSSEVIENSRSQARLALDGPVPCAPHISSRMSDIQRYGIGKEALRHGLPMAPEPNYQMEVRCSRLVSATPVSSEQDLMESYGDKKNASTFLRKRDRREAQLTAKSTIFKKPKPEQLDLVQQQLNSGQVGVLGADLQWKSTKHQLEAERVRLARFEAIKHPQVMMNESQQAVLEGVPKLDAGSPSNLDPRGSQYCTKDEPAEITKLQKMEIEKDKDVHQVVGIRSNQSNLLQSQLQRRSLLMQAHIPPPVQWSNPGRPVEKDVKKDNASQKRKLSQNPRVCNVGSDQSAVASLRSGEIPSVSVGAPYSTCQSASVVGLRKENAASMSVASVNPVQNDSLLHKNQISLPMKQKCHSLPKIPNMSGVGPSASVSNVNAPFSTASPSVGTPPVPLLSGPKGDPVVLERFLKIKMLTQKHRLSCKDCKVDEYLESKPCLARPELLALKLSQPEDTEGFRDPEDTLPMSKSLIGGSINVCKMRNLIFIRSRRAYQGNGIPVIVHESQSLLMSEHPQDHMVELQVKYGDNESDPQYDLPMLPSTHYADLLAAQFASLMMRNGYQLANDEIHPHSPSIDGASSSHPAFPGVLPWSGLPELPHPKLGSGQLVNVVTSMSNSISSQRPQQLAPQNIIAGACVLSPDSVQVRQMSSSGYLVRPQQLDDSTHLAAIQQQHSQIQRSLQLIGNNLLGSSTNMQMGNQVVNSAVHMQLHHLQQRQRQQLQQQRKMMTGGPVINLGNMGMMQSIGGSQGLGNMVGLGSMNNVVGMSGLGGSMSATIGGHVPGMCNLSQVSNLNQVSSFGNFSQQLRAGGLSPTQAASFVKMRLPHARGRGMLTGGLIHNSIDSVGGMAGSGLMHGGSVLNPTPSRGVMAQFQRGGMASMGPPRVTSMTPSMNNQQQQQMQQQLQVMHQTGSPLQQMGSPLLSPQVSGLAEQVSSPMAHLSPQQVIGQPVPMSPPQLSSGVGPQQQMSNGNVGAGPGSPQLSSQTLGSVGSITSSPMELRCVAKVDPTVNSGMVGGE